MAFDKDKHLIKMGNRDYLEVKWRLVWFREDHPSGEISTELQNITPPIIKATVKDEGGRTLATGYGSANVSEKKVVWTGREIEKAETAAIGRALAHAGYGTQFSDDDESNLADAPVERKATPQQAQAARQALRQADPTPAAGENKQTEPPAPPTVTPAEARATLEPDALIAHLKNIVLTGGTNDNLINNEQLKSLAIRINQYEMSDPVLRYILNVAYAVQSRTELSVGKYDSFRRWLDSNKGGAVNAEIAKLAEFVKSDSDAAFNALGS